jgi:hypothetical protein
MTTLDDELDAAEHACCKLFDDDGPPWMIGPLRWGFPSNPIPRMSVVVVAGLRFRGVVIHLEDDIGNRAVIVRGALPDRIREPLHSWVTSNRDVIEQSWIKIMISRGWIRIEAKGKTVVVTAYPGATTVITRTLDFTDCPVWVESDDVIIDGGATLVLGVRNPVRAQVRHRLGALIWSGRADGSDAGTIPW